jgi:catechol-2,3-dioxygenase
MAGPAMKLAYAHLKVRDLKRSVEFYARCLGLDVVESDDYRAFLGSAAGRPDVVLQSIGSFGQTPHPYSVGLHHLAFVVADGHAFASAYQTLAGEGVAASAVEHASAWALYFTDPDGNGLAVTWNRGDTAASHHGSQPLAEARILGMLLAKA